MLSYASTSHPSEWKDMHVVLPGVSRRTRKISKSGLYSTHRTVDNCIVMSRTIVSAYHTQPTHKDARVTSLWNAPFRECPKRRAQPQMILFVDSSNFRHFMGSLRIGSFDCFITNDNWFQEMTQHCEFGGKGWLSTSRRWYRPFPFMVKSLLPHYLFGNDVHWVWLFFFLNLWNIPVRSTSFSDLIRAASSYRDAPFFLYAIVCGYLQPWTAAAGPMRKKYCTVQ